MHQLRSRTQSSLIKSYPYSQAGGHLGSHVARGQKRSFHHRSAIDERIQEVLESTSSENRCVVDPNPRTGRADPAKILHSTQSSRHPNDAAENWQLTSEAGGIIRRSGADGVRPASPSHKRNVGVQVAAASDPQTPCLGGRTFEGSFARETHRREITINKRQDNRIVD